MLDGAAHSEALAFFGYSLGDLPAFVILNKESNRQYHLDQSRLGGQGITDEILVDHARKVLAAQVRPFLMSSEPPKEVPQGRGHMGVLVGDTYDQIVLNPSLN